MKINPFWEERSKGTNMYIVSYPRSGNRWVRSMLADVLVSPEGLDQQTAVKRLRLPDMHQPPPPEYLQASPDELGSLILKSHNIRGLMDRRMVYLFRTAADALVSYYHLLMQTPAGQAKLEGVGIDRFCADMIPTWVEHVCLALEIKARHPAQVLLVAYEKLLTGGVRELERITGFLDLPTNEAALERVVKDNSFERSKARQPAAETAILRKGKAGSGAEELQPETTAKILAATKEVYAEAAAAAS